MLPAPLPTFYPPSSILHTSVPTPTACIAGASGLVGSHLLPLLLDGGRYERVVAAGRRPLGLRHHRLEEVIAGFGALPDLPPCDDAFCCLGTTIKKAGSEEAFRRVDYDFVLAFGEAVAQVRARRFFVVSAMGADPDSRIFYNRLKGEMERDAAALPFEAVRVFRPALLLGDRAESRPKEAAMTVLFRVIGPLLVGPLRRYRAIPAADVAAAMARAAADPDLGLTVYESDEIAAVASR